MDFLWAEEIHRVDVTLFTMLDTESSDEWRLEEVY